MTDFKHCNNCQTYTTCLERGCGQVREIRASAGDEFDAERVLKQELAELHVLYHRQAAPILKQLARLEAMKPPRPIWIDMAMIDPRFLEVMKKVPVDPTKQTPLERLACLEHEREQLLHLLRMVRSAAGNTLPPSMLAMIDSELRDA